MPGRSNRMLDQRWHRRRCGRGRRCGGGRRSWAEGALVDQLAAGQRRQSEQQRRPAPVTRHQPAPPEAGKLAGSPTPGKMRPCQPDQSEDRRRQAVGQPDGHGRDRGDPEGGRAPPRPLRGGPARARPLPRGVRGGWGSRCGSMRSATCSPAARGATPRAYRCCSAAISTASPRGENSTARSACSPGSR